MADAQVQRIALVTGASRGIGASLAESLARDGYHVLLVARTEAGLIETEDRIHAAGGSASIVPLDLRKNEAIDSLAAVVAERWSRLDMLVLNAAMLGNLSPLSHADPDEFERVIRLNLIAQWRLLRNFDAMLRQSSGMLIAFTSSVASKPRPYWGAYAASKAALENMMEMHAAETMALGVRVLLVDPGRTRTAMRAHAYPGEDPETLKPPQAVADAIVQTLPELQPGLRRLVIDPAGRIVGDQEAG